MNIRHQGLEGVLSVLNMPPPMNKSAYKDSVQTLCNTAKKEAETSMRIAVSQNKELYEGGENGIVNIAVSGDGTWRKRGTHHPLALPLYCLWQMAKYWTQR